MDTTESGHSQGSPALKPAGSGSLVRRGAVGIARLRLLASLPVAVVALLVVTSVAFGAVLIPNAVFAPAAGPVAVVTAESPTNVPTQALTAAPVDATPSPRPHTDSTVVPAPTAAPPTTGPIVDLGALGEADNLDHTFTFTWSAYTGGAFSGYVLVYETTALGKVPSYSDGSPVWATPGPADTSVNIPWPAPGSYQIRIQAIGTVGGKTVALAQTAVNHAHLSASASQPPATPVPSAVPVPTVPGRPTSVSDLGALGVGDNLDRTFTFTWSGYTGGSSTGYVLVYETTASGRIPSSAAGSPVWASPAPGATTVNIPWPAPGSYQARIEAIGVVDGQARVLAQTSVVRVHLSAPARTSSPSSAPAETTSVPAV